MYAIRSYYAKGCRGKYIFSCLYIFPSVFELDCRNCISTVCQRSCERRCSNCPSIGCCQSIVETFTYCGCSIGQTIYSQVISAGIINTFPVGDKCLFGNICCFTGNRSYNIYWSCRFSGNGNSDWFCFIRRDGNNVRMYF